MSVDQQGPFAVLHAPISVEDALFDGDEVWVRWDEREGGNECELPGGKPLVREQPSAALQRTLLHELKLPVRVIKPVHTWRYSITVSDIETRVILVLTYLCEAVTEPLGPLDEGEKIRLAWWERGAA